MSYQDASRPIFGWAVGHRYWKPCIVETLIPIEQYHQYLALELKPEYIYRIYPRFEYFIYDVPSLPNGEIRKFAGEKKFFVIQNPLFKDVPNSAYSLLKPHPKHHNPYPLIETRNYYLPLYVTKGKAIGGEMELDQHTPSDIVTFYPNGKYHYSEE